VEVELNDVDAVLFDMDGTLVDSDAAVERAWTTWSQRYGVEAAALTALHGSPADHTVRRLLPTLGPDAVSRAAADQLELQYDDVADVVATAGAHRVIEVLARSRTPWAVVTSADRRLAAARLGAAGIEAPVLVTVEDVSVGKPDPEGFLLAARRLTVPIARCLVVEDSEPGVAAGRAAGARTAALKGLDADVRLADLDALASLLESR
jgi:sugar-phosphatase